MQLILGIPIAEKETDNMVRLNPMSETDFQSSRNEGKCPIIRWLLNYILLGANLCVAWRVSVHSMHAAGWNP
jgi:hypothetical protein